MALDWGIIGAGVRPYDEAQRLKLAEQDYLSTLIELDPSRQAIVDFVPRVGVPAIVGPQQTARTLAQKEVLFLVNGLDRM